MNEIIAGLKEQSLKMSHLDSDDFPIDLPKGGESKVFMTKGWIGLRVITIFFKRKMKITQTKHFNWWFNPTTKNWELKIRTEKVYESEN